MLTVWDVCVWVRVCMYFLLYNCSEQLDSSTKKPHQKFCLWFTCIEFPSAADGWGESLVGFIRPWPPTHTWAVCNRVWSSWNESPHLTCTARKWSEKKPLLIWKRAAASLSNQKRPPQEEHQIWAIMGIYHLPQASQHLSYWFAPLQRHRWTDMFKWSLYSGSESIIISLCLLLS